MVAQQSAFSEKLSARWQEPYVLFPTFSVLLLVLIWAGCLHLIRVERDTIERRPWIRRRNWLRHMKPR